MQRPGLQLMIRLKGTELGQMKGEKGLLKQIQELGCWTMRCPSKDQLGGWVKAYPVRKSNPNHYCIGRAEVPEIGTTIRLTCLTICNHYPPLLVRCALHWEMSCYYGSRSWARNSACAFNKNMGFVGNNKFGGSPEAPKPKKMAQHSTDEIGNCLSQGTLTFVMGIFRHILHCACGEG